MKQINFTLARYDKEPWQRFFRDDLFRNLRGLVESETSAILFEGIFIYLRDDTDIPLEQIERATYFGLPGFPLF